MKAIREFNLPEEQEEYEMYQNAGKYYCILNDMYQELRGKVKYAQIEGDTLEAYNDMYEFLQNLVVDSGVDIP